MSKELEALKKVRHCTYTFAKDSQEAFDVIETALKALEIIKEKEVDVGEVIVYEDYDTYCKWFKANVVGRIMLTQEEYDLLKEVLL